MPTLCRAGILVECCVLGIPENEGPQDAPGGCPGDCPCDTRDESTDDTESSSPRNCDTCTESCNVISTHSKQTDGDDFTVKLVVTTAAAKAPCDDMLSHQCRSHNLDATRLTQHLRVPTSDRPLLI